jgi:hypothetical protein
MRDRLNFFEPWERLPPNHENQLTRALLVVLRCCPIAQQAWLSLVDRDLTLHSLPRPTFDTQRGKILRSEGQLTTDEPIRGISVLCSADAPSEAPGVVLESDRGMVLDGIILYPGEIVVVLESKLDGPADDRNARNINLHGQPIDFKSAPIWRISWRNVLAAFTDLADEARGLTSGAERETLTDFLDFVDRNFPKLGPCSTLQRCRAEVSRVTRRLRTILSEVLGSDDATLPGAHAAVTTAYLGYESGQVQLSMYPADTLQQARAFYDRPKIVERILALEHDGWSISPNFHFGFMARGFCWMKSAMPLAEYMSYWQQHIEDTRQIERRDWNEYWDKLEKLKIAEPTDREAFDHNFTTTTGRHSATPRPGIKCKFAWSLDEAGRLDSRGQLTKAVKKPINELLEALGEDKIDAG